MTYSLYSLTISFGVRGLLRFATFRILQSAVWFSLDCKSKIIKFQFHDHFCEGYGKAVFSKQFHGIVKIETSEAGIICQFSMLLEYICKLSSYT